MFNLVDKNVMREKQRRVLDVLSIWRGHSKYHMITTGKAEIDLWIEISLLLLIYMLSWGEKKLINS